MSECDSSQERINTVDLDSPINNLKINPFS